MKAITYDRYGGPEVLRVSEVPEPRLGPDSVLIDVKAASVNPVDWQIAAGQLDSRFDIRFPVIPGWDAAGVVARAGAAVTEFSAGDAVFAYVREDMIGRGTYAEQVAAPLRTVARKPATVSWEEAAAVPVAGLTAYQSVVHGLHITAGDTLLVQAAAGGVGTFAVQIALARGARVIGCASPRNLGYVTQLGAHAVSYQSGLERQVRAISPQGVTAVLDMYGGEALRTSLSLLRDDLRGRVVSLVNDGVRQCGGTYVFARPSSPDLGELARMIDSHALRPQAGTVMNITAAPEAFRLSRAGHVRGKISLTMNFGT